jgi:hypothetical protein
MTRKSSRWRGGFTVSLVVCVLLACGSIRQDEFLCENAVSHLVGCCPGFDASVVECHYDAGCLGTTYPELDETQSNCILAQSCATLRAAGVCDRVAALPDEGLEDGGSTPPVCAAGPAVAAGQSSGDDASEEAPTIECHSASDCADGRVCCGVLNGAGANLECMAGPCASGIQLCATSSECDFGDSCQEGPADAIMLCAPEDASSAAPSDGATFDSTIDGEVADARSVDDAGSVAEGGPGDSGGNDAAADAPAAVDGD